MDVSYWIFILVVYLISQWVQSKSKKTSTDKELSQYDNNEVNDNLPQWIKNLDPQGNNYNDLNFSKDTSIEKKQSFENLDAQRNDYNDLNFSKEPNIEKIKIPIDQVSKVEDNNKNLKIDETKVEIKEDAYLSKSSQILLKSKKKLKKSNSLTIFDLLYNKKSNLRNVVLLNEILGQPRSIIKYNSKK